MRNFIEKSYHQLDHERAFNSSFFPMSFIYIQLFERRLANYLLSKELLCIFIYGIFSVVALIFKNKYSNFS